MQAKLCEDCAEHTEKYTHLVGGRGMQHIMKDNELTIMIQDVNRKDLLSVLVVTRPVP